MPEYGPPGQRCGPGYELRRLNSTKNSSDGLIFYDRFEEQSVYLKRPEQGIFANLMRPRWYHIGRMKDPKIWCTFYDFL